MKSGTETKSCVRLFPFESCKSQCWGLSKSKTRKKQKTMCSMWILSALTAVDLIRLVHAVMVTVTHPLHRNAASIPATMFLCRITIWTKENSCRWGDLAWITSCMDYSSSWRDTNSTIPIPSVTFPCWSCHTSNGTFHKAWAHSPHCYRGRGTWVFCFVLSWTTTLPRVFMEPSFVTVCFPVKPLWFLHQLKSTELWFVLHKAELMTGICDRSFMVLIVVNSPFC